MFQLPTLTPQAWISVAVTLAILVIIQVRKGVPVDLLFMAGLVIVTLSGAISPEMALRGFASSAVITIGGLLVVATALRSTGVLDWVGQLLLGSARTEGAAVRRLAMALVSTSAFVLNTPLVAMITPVVTDWCRRRDISPSRILIPVSYLTILGGVCTLIGTSTTLIVNATLRDQQEHWSATAPALLPPMVSPQGVPDPAERHARFVENLHAMEFFELGKAGLPCAVVGALFIVLVGRHLLPDRRELIEALEDERREYLVEMMVGPGCRLIGQTVEGAGLRSLPGLYLIEIDRDGEIITPVSPNDHVRAGDRLVFTGIVNTIVDLERIPGLIPAADTTYEFHPRPNASRYLTEAVLSRTSPLIGRTLKEADFRRHYNAAVVAVHRNGTRISSKLGDIVLEPGDTLLLQTRSEFLPRYRNSRDFYLVSPVDGYTPRQRDRAIWAAGLAILLLAWMSSTSWIQAAGGPAGLTSTSIAAVTIAGLMIAMRCINVGEARNALDLQILLTIVGALGLGSALHQTGAASEFAKALVSAAGDRPYLTLIMVYVLGTVFTEMITNTAVAALLIPLAIDVAWQGGYNPRPFVMAISLSASLSFMTPVGYQTNLMVMGPGNYRPSDYLRAGMPLSLLVSAVALFLIPRIWPLM